jgi:4-carboxymuconolactone decarboxylase
VCGRGSPEPDVPGQPTAEGPVSDTSLPEDLRVLVRLSAAVALGIDHELDPFLSEADRCASPGEVEETLLQSYLFLGYPAALNALRDWRRVSGRRAPAAHPGSWEDWSERGPAVCSQVYGDAYQDLRDNIRGLSPEMDRWMVVEGYGKVIGRQGMVLWRRECCIAAILVVLGAAPQLRSHLRGALRTGAPVATVAEVVQEACGLASSRRAAGAQAVWDEVRTRWEDR